MIPILALLAAAVAVPAAAEIKPRTGYQVFGATVASPNQAGWRVVQSKAQIIAFGRQGTAKGDTIVAAVTVFKVDRAGSDREVLTYIVNERTRAEAANKRRITVLENTNVHARFRGATCVKYTNRLENLKRGARGGKFTKNNGYICRHPIEKTMFHILEFSNRSDQPEFDPGLRKIGESFFAGVKFDRTGL